MMKSVEQIAKLTSFQAVVFTEVHQLDGEDPILIANELRSHGCAVIIDEGRERITAFPRWPFAPLPNM
jgi:hypothetical protein